MTEYTFDSTSLQKDGKPWFPVMGEIHYSRYPKAYWKEAICKMKAGGVDIISTYAIWIHLEEIEGEWDFSGNRSLRAFLQTIKDCGMKLLLRVGPWVHGEVRNGGFPDWLLEKKIPLRCNDPAYLHYVTVYYQHLFEQAEGFLLKDGGPIIGLQIENEYGHCGGLQGEEGELHMKTLLQIAKDTGFEVPIYTATGWGGAVTGGMLPVMGGYCDAPWDPRTDEIEPSGNFIFSYERNDHNIGSDYGLGHGITFDMNRFPFLTAELGGGLQVTHHRRPVALGTDIGAMSLVKMGSGCNLLGYYMYHGGTNPDGKKTTLQESKATGYPNDLPVKSYDFNAPIKEYGQTSDSYREIRLLSSFLHDFGTELCKMPAYIEEDSPKHPENNTDLRTSIRHNGTSGYVFVNNYQRHQTMAVHEQVQLSVELPKERIIFPELTVPDGDFFFLPFNMKLSENTVLKTACVSPLCCLNGSVYVFYGTRKPQFVTDGPMEGITLLNLSREDALLSRKVTLDQDYLFMSNADVYAMDGKLYLEGSERRLLLRTYPALTNPPKGMSVEYVDGWGFYTRDMSDYTDLYPDFAEIAETECSDTCTTYEIRMEKAEEMGEKLNNCFLNLEYEGDRFELFVNGKYVDDHFYTGQRVGIGLKRYGYPKQVELKVYPLKQGDPVYLEYWPLMTDGRVCHLLETRLQKQYRYSILSDHGAKIGFND